MNFRLGYVAMTLNLEDCSPSSTVTLFNLNKLADEKAKLYRLRQITKKNLSNTMRILKYNKAIDVYVYRLTSKLVPLATHPSVSDWDYNQEFKSELSEIGTFIKKHNFRVSFHPDHFTLINSNNPKVHEDSIRDLDYHCGIFDAMGLSSDEYKLVIHVGGVYKDKQGSIERFKENYIKLPENIRTRLILENDDKSFTSADVLKICTELGIPMVIDIHHHQCINNGEPLKEILPLVFDTWKHQKLTPKVHFSSPKSAKDFRSHAGYIDSNAFWAFIKAAKKCGSDFDVMLEAKNKDTALLKLSSDLEQNDGLEKINTGEFKII